MAPFYFRYILFCRYASLFLQPVTNEIAPNYSSIVLRPIDLITLKKNVENGIVSVTTILQRHRRNKVFALLNLFQQI